MVGGFVPPRSGGLDVAADRVVVIDEDLNPQLAQELAGRGIPARSATRDMGLAGRTDPEVIRAVAALDDAVLVTGDRRMPSAHRKSGRPLSSQATISPSS